jgi:hypothetical protein
MTFEEVLAQIIEALQREKRISYRALKRRFALDDAYLDDLKEELIYAKRLALDEDSRVLVSAGDAEAPLLPAPPASPPGPPQIPLAVHVTQTDGPPTPPQPPAAERRPSIGFLWKKRCRSMPLSCPCHCLTTVILPSPFPRNGTSKKLWKPFWRSCGSKPPCTLPC